jgi:hypothetical protein
MHGTDTGWVDRHAKLHQRFPAHGAHEDKHHTYTTNVTGSHTTADLLQHVILPKARANAVDGTTAVHTDAAFFCKN